MRNYPKNLKRKLLDTICQMREELLQCTDDPKRDFTRNRKLPSETLCRTILSMSGQSPARDNPGGARCMPETTAGPAVRPAAEGRRKRDGRFRKAVW